MELLASQEDMSQDEALRFLKKMEQSDQLGSFEAAYQTVKYLRQKISDSQWGKAREALDLVKEQSARLLKGQRESSVGNMIRRVMKIIKDEHFSSGKEKTDERDTQESLQKLLLADDDEEEYNQPKENLKESVIDSMCELLSELETSAEIVCANSIEHIQNNEVIMTLGNSRLVERFFKTAVNKKRKFQVIIVESFPNYRGHELAKALTEADIKTTVVSDAAVFAMMSRCNKVIIGTNSVMADGGLKASSGTHTLALAAKHYSVPLIVLAPMYKLTPQYLSSYDQDKFNQTISPHHVLPYNSGEIINRVSVSCPLYDYVPPDLVSTYATNIGGYAPPYIYRLLADLYHPDDYNLKQELNS